MWWGSVVMPFITSLATLFCLKPFNSCSKSVHWSAADVAQMWLVITVQK
jgi:hypothetical protein